MEAERRRPLTPDRLGGTVIRRLGALLTVLIMLTVLAGLAVFGVLSYRLGWVRLSYPSESRFPVQGIDISHHQGLIDWTALSGHGIGFAFIKSTEGETLTDTRFATNSQAALTAGIPWAPYHFFTFCTPGTNQAAHFYDTAGHRPRQLPPAVDIEFAGNCRGWTDLNVVRAELDSFLEQVEQDFGERPVLYVTKRTQQELLAGHFPDYARWPRSLLREPPTPIFGAWSFWQFADNARLPGIRGPVDLNAYCCALSNFPHPSKAFTAETK